MKALSRVFALAPDCHASGRYQRLWQRHFYDGIAAAVPDALFPQGVGFEWARPVVSAPLGPSPDRARVSQQIFEQIRATHAAAGLDAVISYCFGSDLEPPLIPQVIALGIPWVNFFCDSTYAFDRVQAIAGVASLNWFPEHAAIPSYQSVGRPWLCRPYAINPDRLPDASCETADHVLGFVGAPTGNRIVRLASLLALGCRTAVRGEGWSPTPRVPARRPQPRDGRARGALVERGLNRILRPLVRDGARPLAEDEMVPFLSRCRVVLGLTEGRDLNGAYSSYMKFRDIEYPGHGCCVGSPGTELEFAL